METFFCVDLAIAWSGAAIFDTVIFLLTFVKRIREFAVLKGGLLSVMLRDGERTMCPVLYEKLISFQLSRNPLLWVMSMLSRTYGNVFIISTVFWQSSMRPIL